MSMIKEVNDLKKTETAYMDMIARLEQSMQYYNDKLKTVQDENGRKMARLRTEVEGERRVLAKLEQERDEYKERVTKAHQTSYRMVAAPEGTPKSFNMVDSRNDKSGSDRIESDEEPPKNGLQSLISNIIAGSKRRSKKQY